MSLLILVYATGWCFGAPVNFLEEFPNGVHANSAGLHSRLQKRTGSSSFVDLQFPEQRVLSPNAKSKAMFLQQPDVSPSSQPSTSSIPTSSPSTSSVPSPPLTATPVSGSPGPQSSAPGASSSPTIATPPSDQMPPVSAPPAQMPPASAPPAQMPPASAPPAQMPQASAPPAQIPQASAPPAQMPQASAPQGSSSPATGSGPNTSPSASYPPLMDQLHQNQPHETSTAVIQSDVSQSKQASQIGEGTVANTNQMIAALNSNTKQFANSTASRNTPALMENKKQSDLEGQIVDGAKTLGEMAEKNVAQANEALKVTKESTAQGEAFLHQTEQVSSEFDGITNKMKGMSHPNVKSSLLLVQVDPSGSESITLSQQAGDSTKGEKPGVDAYGINQPPSPQQSIAQTALSSANQQSQQESIETRSAGNPTVTLPSTDDTSRVSPQPLPSIKTSSVGSPSDETTLEQSVQTPPSGQTPFSSNQPLSSSSQPPSSSSQPPSSSSLPPSSSSQSPSSSSQPPSPLNPPAQQPASQPPAIPAQPSAPVPASLPTIQTRLDDKQPVTATPESSVEGQFNRQTTLVPNQDTPPLKGKEEIVNGATSGPAVVMQETGYVAMTGSSVVSGESAQVASPLGELPKYEPLRTDEITQTTTVAGATNQPLPTGVAPNKIKLETVTLPNGEGEVILPPTVSRLELHNPQLSASKDKANSDNRAVPSFLQISEPKVSYYKKLRNIMQQPSVQGVMKPEDYSSLMKSVEKPILAAKPKIDPLKDLNIDHLLKNSYEGRLAETKHAKLGPASFYEARVEETKHAKSIPASLQSSFLQDVGPYAAYLKRIQHKLQQSDVQDLTDPQKYEDLLQSIKHPAEHRVHQSKPLVALKELGIDRLQHTSRSARISAAETSDPHMDVYEGIQEFLHQKRRIHDDARLERMAKSSSTTLS